MDFMAFRRVLEDLRMVLMLDGAALPIDPPDLGLLHLGEHAASNSTLLDTSCKRAWQ